jgi:hypothetical protein
VNAVLFALGTSPPLSAGAIASRGADRHASVRS